MKSYEAISCIDAHEDLWTILGLVFAGIAERGNMDELFLVAKGVEMFIEKAQQKIALRN